MLHNKMYVSDDYITCIGSTNADNLSFFLNYEVSSIIYDAEVAHGTKERFLEEQEHCREIMLKEVEKWNVFRKLRNWFFRIAGGPVG